MTRADFILRNEGTISLLKPISQEAKDWIEEFIPEDAQHWGTMVVIGHQYVEDVVNGIFDAGMEIEGQ